MPRPGSTLRQRSPTYVPGDDPANLSVPENTVFEAHEGSTFSSGAFGVFRETHSSAFRDSHGSGFRQSRSTTFSQDGEVPPSHSDR